jgi:hypothetical protein
MADIDIIEEIENIFVSELGDRYSFILDKNLNELGLTREKFSKDDVNILMDNLMRDFDKLLGTHVLLIEDEIRKLAENNS